MSAGIPPPPSESPWGHVYETPLEAPISNHHESTSGPEIPANAKTIADPQRGAVDVFQNNTELQMELEQIQEGRVLGVQLSDFRRSGEEDDFDSKDIDVKGLLSSLRHMRANSQTQYRTLRRRKGEIDGVSRTPTTTESESLRENRTPVLGSSRIAKPRRKPHQELRCSSKRKGGRGSKNNEDSSSAADTPRGPEFTPTGAPRLSTHDFPL
ncbi:hypothetical protein HOY80DRAFT_925354 [Tuber brumale]|nr:hypothetical protein HOY80DRAFT_925354 [Tuber brumale]